MKWRRTEPVRAPTRRRTSAERVGNKAATRRHRGNATGDAASAVHGDVDGGGKCRSVAPTTKAPATDVRECSTTPPPPPPKAASERHKGSLLMYARRNSKAGPCRIGLHKEVRPQATCSVPASSESMYLYALAYCAQGCAVPFDTMRHCICVFLLLFTMHVQLAAPPPLNSAHRAAGAAAAAGDSEAAPDPVLASATAAAAAAAAAAAVSQASADTAAHAHTSDHHHHHMRGARAVQPAHESLHTHTAQPTEPLQHTAAPLVPPQPPPPPPLTLGGGRARCRSYSGAIAGVGSGGAALLRHTSEAAMLSVHSARSSRGVAALSTTCASTDPVSAATPPPGAQAIDDAPMALAAQTLTPAATSTDETRVATAGVSSGDGNEVSGTGADGDGGVSAAEASENWRRRLRFGARKRRSWRSGHEVAKVYMHTQQLQVSDISSCIQHFTPLR
jgi:hypothetical protein